MQTYEHGVPLIHIENNFNSIKKCALFSLFFFSSFFFLSYLLIYVLISTCFRFEILHFTLKSFTFTYFPDSSTFHHGEYNAKNCDESKIKVRLEIIFDMMRMWVRERERREKKLDPFFLFWFILTRTVVY